MTCESIMKGYKVDHLLFIAKRLLKQAITDVLSGACLPATVISMLQKCEQTASTSGSEVEFNFWLEIASSGQTRTWKHLKRNLKKKLMRNWFLELDF
mgnify:CR=1 FL=1